MSADIKIYIEGVQVTDFISARLTRVVETGANSLEIVLPLKEGVSLSGGFLSLAADQTVTVYSTFGVVDTADTNDFRGSFVIQDIEIKDSERRVYIKCSDKTFQLLSRVFVGEITDTPNNIVDNIVQRLNQDGSGSTVTTNIVATKSDGSAFDSVTFYSDRMSGYEAIKDLSSPGFTGDDSDYLFFFDEAGTFHWTYRSDTLQSSELIYGTKPVQNMRIVQAESQDISMINYNAGNDKNGVAILGFVLQDGSTSIEGRVKYLPLIDISPRIKRSLGASYAATSNADFIALCEQYAEAAAQTYMRRTRAGLWEAIVELKGTKLDVGALYTVKASELGFPGQNMRLERLIHYFDAKGWRTRAELKQDPKDL